MKDDCLFNRFLVNWLGLNIELRHLWLGRRLSYDWRWSVNCKNSRRTIRLILSISKRSSAWFIKFQPFTFHLRFLIYYQSFAQISYIVCRKLKVLLDDSTSRFFKFFVGILHFYNQVLVFLINFWSVFLIYLLLLRMSIDRVAHSHLVLVKCTIVGQIWDYQRVAYDCLHEKVVHLAYNSALRVICLTMGSEDFQDLILKNNLGKLVLEISI